MYFKSIWKQLLQGQPESVYIHCIYIIQKHSGGQTSAGYQCLRLIIINKYRLIHGHFHIGLASIPRHPYWPETNAHVLNYLLYTSDICRRKHRKLFILSETHEGLFYVKIWTVYFRSFWSYKNSFILAKYVINNYIKNSINHTRIFSSKNNKNISKSL